MSMRLTDQSALLGEQEQADRVKHARTVYSNSLILYHPATAVNPVVSLLHLPFVARLDPLYSVLYVTISHSSCVHKQN